MDSEKLLTSFDKWKRQILMPRAVLKSGGHCRITQITKEEEGVNLASVKLEDMTSPGETSCLYLWKEPSIPCTCPVTRAVTAQERQKTLKSSESKILTDVSWIAPCSELSAKGQASLIKSLQDKQLQSQLSRCWGHSNIIQIIHTYPPDNIAYFFKSSQNKGPQPVPLFCWKLNQSQHAEFFHIYFIIVILLKMNPLSFCSTLWKTEDN